MAADGSGYGRSDRSSGGCRSSGTSELSAPVFAEDIRKDLQSFFEMELLGIGERMERKLRNVFKQDATILPKVSGDRRQCNSVASVSPMKFQRLHSCTYTSERNLLTIGNRKSFIAGKNRNSMETTRFGSIEEAMNMSSSGHTEHDTYHSGHQLGGGQDPFIHTSSVPSSQGRCGSEGHKDEGKGVDEWNRMESDDEDHLQRTQRALEPRRSEDVRSISVRNWHVEMVVVSLVMLNAISLGLQAEFCAKHQTTHLPEYYVFLDRLFCAVFVLEQALKWKFLRWDMFYEYSIEDALSLSFSAITDFILVFLQVCSEVAASLQGHEIRALQFFQIMRTFSVFRAFRPLRTLMVSISDSMREFFNSMFVLALVTYVFSVIMTFVATDAQMQADGDLRELEHLFGSVDRSFLTLFEVVSDGVHWKDVVEPLMLSCPPLITIVFICYTTFAVFVLVNIIRSSFVDGALRKGEEDRKAVLMSEIADLIIAADENDSGTISWDEFQNHLSDPQMQALLKAIDFNQDEARSLFRLLDPEDYGEIEVHEFMSGCIRLQGIAKAVELAALMSEMSRFVKDWRAHTVKIEELLLRVPPETDVSRRRLI